MDNRLAISMTGLLLAGSLAYSHEGDADHEKKEQEHFQMMKQEMLKELDAQLDILQSLRSCVGSAADHAAVKKCHQEKEASMRSAHEAKKKERLQRIEEQQQKLEKEKTELQKQDAKP